MESVVLSPCENYTEGECRKALEAALAPIDGLDWVKPGMRVGIKANLVSAMEPAAAATTHPGLLAALTEMLTERGATVVIGDSPGGLYNAAHLERVYRVCGLTQIASAELNTDFSQKEGRFPEGKVLRGFTYTGWLDSCDGIINCCKLKTHGMLAMTGAVKNFFGAIPGTMKPEYHFRFPEPMDFANMIVDLQEFFRPRLHLVDAVTVMEGNGPTAGTPRHMGLVLASQNPYALDAVCEDLLGLGKNKVLTQVAAKERGLLPEEFEIIGDVASYRAADLLLPPAKSTLFRNLLPGKAGEALGRAIQRVLEPKPVLHTDKCVGCEKCARICPAMAITMKNGKPSIDRKQCIKCFCCQEFCPKGALEAHRTAVAKILSK